MTIREALHNRRSMRAFLPEPIPRDVLVQVLKDASYAPSWANSQPWEVFVAEGETLSRIKTAYADCYAKGVKATPEIPHPVEWPESAKARLKNLHPDMVRDCGDAVNQFGSLNQKMFNAPCVLFVCMDKILTQWSLYDIGAWSQSFMLSALEQGLGTIPAITTVLYPDILRKELNIPDNLKITIGIAVGYPDKDNAINNYRSARTPVEENVTFCG